MTELSIKVKIAEREYPISVKPEEEQGVRMAAKMINDNVRDLEQNYAVRDKIDLLAMTALQFATQVAEGKVGTVEDENVIKSLLNIDKLLADQLDKK
jgi:cell division protein ZapA